MEINIKTENENVAIRESKDCKEHDVVNAYAVALAMKCNSMFKKKEIALTLLEEAYVFSRQTLNDLYDKQHES